MGIEVLGILNVTPDSFSDGGEFVALDAARTHARTMMADGASIVDVGGESTRPGAKPVSVEHELDRTISVIEALTLEGIPTSIDTRHEIVAREAVAHGAGIINDVSASLGGIAAELGVSWIAMHMAGTPQDMQDEPSYENVVTDVLGELVTKANAATELGCPRVLVDPGFGFGKTFEHNMALVANIDVFTASGFDVALGVSRKSSLGVLATKSAGPNADVSVDDRLEYGLVAACWAEFFGASMVRTHDVSATVSALSTTRFDSTK